MLGLGDSGKWLARKLLFDVPKKRGVSVSPISTRPEAQSPTRSMARFRRGGATLPVWRTSRRDMPISRSSDHHGVSGFGDYSC